MGLRINTNIAALTAQRYLGKSGNAMTVSLERLSSGMRINRAADNPAGLVTSEKQRAQIAGLNQAIENSERGVSMIQTAEASLSEVASLLNKVRGLALDSANASVHDTASLAANQREITDALASIDRISANAQFGSKKLLDGSNKNTISITDGGNTHDLSFDASTLATGTDTVTISGFAGATYTAANASTVGISSAPSVYSVSGIEAGDHTVEVTQASTYGDLVGTVDITALGAALATGDTLTVAASGTAAEALVVLVGDDGADAIGTWVTAWNNAIDASTNYSTTGAGGLTILSAKAGTGNVLEFVTGNTAGTGYDEGSSASVTVSAVSITDALVSGLDDIGYLSGNLTTTGTNAIVEIDGTANTVTSTGFAGTTAITLTDASSNSLSIQASALGLNVGTAILTVASATGSIGLSGAASVAFTAGTEATLTDANGETVKVTVGESIAAGGSEGITAVNNALVFQIGANNAQTTTMGLDDTGSDQLALNVTNTSSFSNLSEIDVTTSQGAQDTLLLVDDAISGISTLRGNLGSFQANTLESNLNNLRVASENLSSAESTLRDTDFAAEMAEFTKNQILVQAGMTVLSNATQTPQSVLSLLR